jgi:phage terminase large subunit-like protein
MVKRIAKPPADLNGYDPLRGADLFRWDGKAAADAVEFFPQMLRHVKGFTGPLTLAKWQRNYIATLYGWKRKDGTRRYRESLLAVPRKNGKTTLCAGIALHELFCSSEPGAEVYSAAGSRDQATLVYDPAAEMVRRQPLLAKRAKVIDSTKRILFPDAHGLYRAIPAEAATSHGFNPSCVVFDELHTQPDRELYDVLKTGQGARLQPLFVSITTAGHDRHSICWEVWDYARKVRDGVIDDPHFLPMIYELPEGADWQDAKVWRSLNPNLGVSVSLDFLRAESQRASEIPAYENTFRNLYLNQWTESAIRWLGSEVWDRCNNRTVDLAGCECVAGLDLSSVQDLSALVLAFRHESEIVLECRFWCPQEGIRKRSQRDRVPYQQWAADGWMTPTPGESVDYAFIRHELQQLAQRYTIRKLAIDRWNATQLAGELMDDGLDVVGFGQGYASMSSPAKSFEAAVINGEINHQGNPVLRWMSSNVTVETDAAGNIKPSKSTSTERIDGIVAAVMAFGLLGVDESRSVYADTGVFYLDGANG